MTLLYFVVIIVDTKRASTVGLLGSDDMLSAYMYLVMNNIRFYD